jgi:hypothetical protein
MSWDIYWHYVYPISYAACVLGCGWLWDWDLKEMWPELLWDTIPFLNSIMAILYFFNWWYRDLPGGGKK